MCMSRWSIAGARNRFIRPKMPHVFDGMTNFCVKCGCVERDFFDGYRPFCDELGNVVGVSHIIAQRRLNELITGDVKLLPTSSMVA